MSFLFDKIVLRILDLFYEEKPFIDRFFETGVKSSLATKYILRQFFWKFAKEVTVLVHLNASLVPYALFNLIYLKI